MMLMAYALGLGTCWLGEILKNEDKVKEALGLPVSDFEMVAMLALGYPDDKSKRTERFPLETFVLKEWV